MCIHIVESVSVPSDFLHANQTLLVFASGRISCVQSSQSENVSHFVVLLTREKARFVYAQTVSEPTM